jgi:hypothetical protein
LIVFNFKKLVLLDITVTVGSSAQLCIIKAVPWFRRLVAGLSLQIPGFMPGSVHVGFVVDRVVLGQIFLPSSLVSPVTVILPWLCILIYITWGYEH